MPRVRGAGVIEQGALFAFERVGDVEVPRPIAPADPGWQISPRVARLFARWRARDAGVRVLGEIERRVLARANRGDRRIEVNDVVADIRKDWQVAVNNDLRSAISRWLVERHPFLDPLIKRRANRGRKPDSEYADGAD